MTIAAEPLGPGFRNIPDTDLPVGRIAEAGWHVTDLLLPTATLRRSALAHNAARFAGWCTERGVSHAPHGKTTMAPQLYELQLAAGAWGITAATVAQARLMHAHGVRRVLLANQVVDPAGLRWLAGVRSTDPGFDLYLLVDSVAAVDRTAAVLAGTGVQALVELGVAGGRAGARSVAAAVEVAERVAGSGLALAGVECFEGVYPQDRSAAALGNVDALLAGLTGLLRELDGRGLFGDRAEVLLTAGGSVYPDRAVDMFDRLPALSRPVRRVVRSGGYLVHDHAMYERWSAAGDAAGPVLGDLRPALELWAYVLSAPEPGLAICGFGKRDAAYDIDLPVPLGRYAAGNRMPLPGARVDRLNDQHAFVRHGGELAAGDLVVFGESHPCTAIEKWPLIPVLDDADRVVDAVRTYF
jgi:D-serine deaminase-like pyridoxal phosphate-dependent protein